MQTISDQAAIASPRHQERHFADAPSQLEACRLLGEIAFQRCAIAPIPADRPLTLYGAGDLGRVARDFVKYVGLDFDVVIDRDARKLAFTADWQGYNLLEPQNVPASVKTGTRVCVSVVKSPYVPLERSILAQGFTDVVPFYDLVESFRSIHPLSNGWFARPFDPDEVEKIEQVLAQWTDDVSRAHHLQFLAWRRLREEWTFENAHITLDDRFFTPEVTSVLGPRETFVDAGAHAGAVSATFARRVNGAFKEIVAIEPDQKNREKLSKTFEQAFGDDPRARILDYVLGANDSDAFFHDRLDYASQLSGTGKTKVRAHPLDALNIAPSFVKLHLEGAELPVLMGARQTLLRHRPIVAATVYHNEDGVWRTAQWLMNTLSQYRFYFRLHSWCGTGAVIYGVPEERGPRSR